MSILKGREEISAEAAGLPDEVAMANQVAFDQQE
jgi:hypothetical protein